MTLKRHIQQSVTPDFCEAEVLSASAVSVVDKGILAFLLEPMLDVLRFGMPSARIWRRAFVLNEAKESIRTRCLGCIVEGVSVKSDLLEAVGASLPGPIKLDSHLHASIHLLCTTLIIYSKL